MKPYSPLILVSLTLVSAFPCVKAAVVVTLSCLQTALNCMNAVYDKLGIDSANLQNYFAQIELVVKGQLQKPWASSCTNSESVFTAAPFDCFNEKVKLCDAGLQADVGITAASIIAANDVFRSYCAMGCENLAERASNQSKCLQNVTQSANLTSDEKAVRCTDAQNAVYCAVDAGKGCEFTSNYLNLSLSSIQQTIDKIVQPVTCTLHLVKQITTQPTTSPATTYKQTASSSLVHTVNTATQSAPVTNELSPQTYTATQSASATQLVATQSSADPGKSQSTTSVTTSEQSPVTAESATNQQSSQSNAQPTVTQPANAQVTMVSPTQASTTSGTTDLQVDVAFMTWTAMLVALKIFQKNIA